MDTASKETNSEGIILWTDSSQQFLGNWVLIKVLREFGCDLPIELWTADSNSIDAVMKASLADHNVCFRSAKLIP